jgi:hypothetical protein
LKEDVEAENRRRLRDQVERVDRQARACAVAEVDHQGGLFPLQLGAWAHRVHVVSKFSGEDAFCPVEFHNDRFVAQRFAAATQRGSHRCPV